MGVLHQTILYAALVFVGTSLFIAGLIDTLRSTTGCEWLVAADVNAKGHLRGLNGTMCAVGVIALWACWDLSAARSLVEAVGVIMIFVAAARIYSMALDGVPGPAGILYLGIESALGAIFLGWPPPVGT